MQACTQAPSRMTMAPSSSRGWAHAKITVQSPALLPESIGRLHQDLVATVQDAADRQLSALSDVGEFGHLLGIWMATTGTNRTCPGPGRGASVTSEVLGPIAASRLGSGSKFMIMHRRTSPLRSVRRGTDPPSWKIWQGRREHLLPTLPETQHPRGDTERGN